MRVMQPSLDRRKPVYGALAGAALSGKRVGILPGLYMETAYVHVFAPAMAAFKWPRSEGEHHPGPWQIVRGAGAVATARVQIVIEPHAALLMNERSDQLKLISGMVRLLANSPCFISAVGNRPLTHESAQLADTQLMALEPTPAWAGREVYINDALSTMLVLLLEPSASLFLDDEIYRAFVLADGIW